MNQNKNPSNEIKISSNTPIKSVISYCQNLLKEEKVKDLHFSAIGNSISKLVNAVEILKAIIPGLYQQNRLATVIFQSVEEGQKIELGPYSKIYPKLEISLFLEKPEKKDEGTQDKLSEEERKKILDAMEKIKEGKMKKRPYRGRPNRIYGFNYRGRFARPGFNRRAYGFGKRNRNPAPLGRKRNNY